MHSCHMHFRLLCTVVICTFVCYAQLSYALSIVMHSCHMHFRLLCTVVICTFVCYAQLSYALSFVMHSCHMHFRLLCAFWAIFELRTFAFLDIFTLEHIANIA